MKSAINSRKSEIQKKSQENIQTAAKLMWELIRVNKTVFFVFILVTVLSVVVYFASLYSGGLIYCLSASISTPWGVATSIFVHGGGSIHLVSNLFALLFLFILFSITNLDLKENSRRIRIRHFIALIFVSGTVSNIFWIFFMPDGHSTGLSGVVYAAQGIVLAISLSNTLSLYVLRKTVTHERRRTFLLWLMNFVIFSTIMASLASNPGVFLSAAPKVNVFVHGVSFLIAFYSALAWFLILKIQRFKFLSYVRFSNVFH